MKHRALLVSALALVLWAALVYVTGGVSGALASVRISSRSVVRPAVLAVLLLGVHAVVYGWQSLDADAEWLMGALGRAIVPLVAAASILVLYAGISCSTLSAGGSDSYGYVSQVDLWLNHQLRTTQPFVETVPIPYADRAFTPLAYEPSGNDHGIVPTYPSGFPVLMAIGKAVAGVRGMYAVVPILGAVTIWLCYLLGTRTASPIVGGVAALGLAASPAFLFMLMPPMSDIPATAFWTAAIFFTLGGSRKYSSLVAGACCAVAIAIRPNLAPLAALPFAYLVWTHGGWRSFAIAVLPGAVFVAAVNTYLYGSPVASGYGDPRTLYAWRYASINLQHNAAWLFESQTPIVLFAVLGMVRRPRANALLGSFVAAMGVSYLFYTPFDAWWYLRFLLPAWPALLILTADGLAIVTARLPRLAQAVVLAVGSVLLVGYQVEFAVTHGVFAQRDAESRYELVGDYVSSFTPANAVVLSMQHSGSLRYYGHRVTLRYDWIAPESLDSTIALLRERGYRPFIVLDDWEEPVFKQRFAGSAIGRLEGKPLADFGGRARLYEPAER